MQGWYSICVPSLLQFRTVHNKVARLCPAMGSSRRVYFLKIYCSVRNFCILVNFFGNAKYGAFSLHIL